MINLPKHTVYNKMFSFTLQLSFGKDQMHIAIGRVAPNIIKKD